MKLMKKIAPIAACLLMLGATAAAADLGSWKTTFGGADTAIVLGADAATADNIGAIKIATALTVTTTSTTSQPVANAHMIEAAGNDLNIGEDFATVDSTLDDEDLPTLLMAGTYRESKGEEDNDVTYTQELEFNDGTNNATFDKNDDDDAGVYLYLDDGIDAYNYVLTFDEAVKFDNESISEDFEMTKLKILGREYTITDATEDGNAIDTLTLMAGALQATQNEYATATYTVKDKTYSVEVPVIADNEDETSVVLKINGESTDEMVEGDTYTLDDDTVVGVVDIMANEGTESGGTDMVTFYLGAEKMWLSDDDEIEMNGEAIDGSNVIIDSATGEWDGLTIAFEPDDNVYLAKGDSWIDPVIGRIKYTFQGIEQDTETFTLDKSEMTLSNNAGKELVLPIVYDEDNVNKSVYLGDELASDNAYAWTRLGGATLTRGEGGNMAYQEGDIVVADSDIEDLKDIQFVAISEGNEAHLITISDIDSADNQITFYDETKSSEKGAFDYNGSGGQNTFDLGFMDINMSISNSTRTITFTRINDDGALLQFDTELGAAVKIALAGSNTTFQIVENGDENAINGIVTYVSNSDGDDVEVHVNTTGLMCGTASSCDISGSDDNTQVAMDETSADNSVSWGAYFEWDTDTYSGATIEYPEEQAIAKAFVSEELTNIPELGTTTSSGNAPTPVEDSDWANVKTKNVIVVGGAGINRAAADLLGLTYPTYGSAEAWQTATGVSAPGIAVVKMLSNPYATGKYAMLVAGWDGVDTQKAATALNEGTPVLSGMTAKLKTSTATVELMA